jgi:hypothetical protein
MADQLPTRFPPMGALFMKPYMEFEFEGKVHRLETLKGGHNGRVARACQSSPPEFDEARQRWVVRITNNIIDIDLAEQPEIVESARLPHRLAGMHIFNNPRRSYASQGLLISVTDRKDANPEFPVDCEFRMHIRVRIPGRPTVVNPTPFRMVAKDLYAWPPSVGTIYTNLDDVDLYPEWVPFGRTFLRPVARIRAGDEAHLTDVFEREDTSGADGRWITRIFNRLT